jgi:hypothetical protein
MIHISAFIFFDSIIRHSTYPFERAAADKRLTSSNDVCPPSQARIDGCFGG